MPATARARRRCRRTPGHCTLGSRVTGRGALRRSLCPSASGGLEGFDAKVLSLYARGLSTREIQGHLEELYGTEVSPTLISTITDAVLDEVRTWQSRPLAAVYPILYFDALFVKSRQEGPVQTKAVYLALGITMDGEKALLGLWLSESEGAKFGLSVFGRVPPGCG